MMRKGYKFSWAEYIESEYPSGTIEVDEDAKEVEAIYEKKSFLSRRKTSLVKFNYNARTKVSTQGNEITVDALTVRIDDPSSLAEVIEILRKPKREALSRAERALGEARRTARELVAKRAEALGLLMDLRAHPRETVIKLASMVPDDAEDPVERILQTHGEGLQQLMKGLKGTLDAERDLLGQVVVESVFALTYGLGMYQDSIYLKDEARGERANELLSNLGCKSPLPVVKEANVPQADPMEKPLEEGFNTIMDQIKESFIISGKPKEEIGKGEASKPPEKPPEEAPKIKEPSERKAEERPPERKAEERPPERKAEERPPERKAEERPSEKSRALEKPPESKAGEKASNAQELYNKTLYSYGLIWGTSAATKRNLEKDIAKLMEEEGLTRDQAIAQLYESVRSDYGRA